jgi:hypothetical protein
MLPKRPSKRVGGMSRKQVGILQKALNNLADDIDEADEATHTARGDSAAV